MRLAEISLLRWGAFADRTIALRPGARLHLLYGPNEAGKTSTLRAVHALLFGIDMQSSFGKAHGSAVRLGGTVVNAESACLSFRRRRARGGTLLGLDDQPLPDDALAPFLGGVDERMFRELFGLDHAAMRAGAEEMLQARGEAGASLFAASGGLRHLVRVREAIGKEADGLFTPSRKVASKPFYQALERFDQAQKRIKNDSLLADAWRDLERAEAEAVAAERRLGEEFQATSRRRAHLERLLRVAPVLRALAGLRGQLAALAGAPVLAEDFRERFDQQRRALEMARQLHGLESQRAAACRAERDAIAVDRTVLDAAAPIDKLYRLIGDFPNKRTDVDKLERDIRLKDADIADRLARLVSPGQTPPREDDAPGEPEEARLKKLAADRRLLGAALDEAGQRLQRAELAWQRLADQQAAQPSVERPAAERALLNEIRQLGPVDEQAAAARRAADTARQAVAEALARLGLADRPAEMVAGLALPDGDTIEDFLRRFQAAEDADRDRRRQAEALAEEIARWTAERDSLTAGGTLPTDEAIAAARHQRDSLWRRARDAHLAGAAWPDGLTGDMENALAEADHLADRRGVESKRLARHAQAIEALARCAESRATLDRRGAEAAAERTRLEESWAALWQPLGITAGPPTAMRDWLKRHREFLDRLQAARQADAADAETRRGHARRRLFDMLDRLSAKPLPPRGGGDDVPATFGRHPRESGDPEPQRQSGRPLDSRFRGNDDLSRDNLSTPDLLHQADAALAAREAAAEAWRDLAARLTQAAELRDTERAERRRAEAALTAWHADWDQALRKAALSPDAAPEAVEAMLRLWGEIRALRHERQGLQRRLDGLLGDIADVTREVERLVALAAPGLALPPAEAAAELHDRLTAARAAQSKAADLATRAESHQKTAEQAAATIAGAEAELTALLRLAGAEDVDALPERLRLAAERADAERQLRKQQSELADRAPGEDEAALAAAVAAEGLDDAALKAEIDALESRIGLLSDQRSQAGADRQAASARLAAERAAQGAADAAQQARMAIAELRDVSEEWMRLRAAELLLAKAIERFRANAQDPMVTRAGDIFRRVTLGRYQGLAVDYDEETPRLTGLDAEGERRPVELMSEGTRDQLYLALRLAAIERYAERAEPMPFLADDLFINWDDHRTEEGLAVLAELGGKTQVLLLTHHLSLIDAARSRLPAEDLDIVRLDELAMEAAGA